MQEQLDLIEQVYELIVNFVVAYSFQLLGAVLVLILGFLVGGWVSRALLRVQEKRGVDVTLRALIASTVRIMVVGLFLIIAAISNCCMPVIWLCTKRSSKMTFRYRFRSGNCAC